MTRQGQAFGDYILLIVVISISLMTMMTYLSRSIKAKAVDTLLSAGFNEQYVEVKTKTTTTTGEESVSLKNANASRSLEIRGGKINIKGADNIDISMQAYP